MNPALLAEIALPTTSFDWTAPLSGAGLAGAMLYWFAIRVERRIKAMENSQDRMTRATLMLVLSLNQHAGGQVARQEARKLSDEIDEAERDRSPSGK